MTLQSPSRNRGYLLFSLLAVVWVLLAGTMNGWRAWERVRAEATPRLQTVVTFNSFTFQSGGGGSQAITTSGNTIIRRNPNGGFTIASGGNSSSTRSTVWGQVSNDAWVSFGWWTGLGILAVAVLIAIAALRRRFRSHPPPWFLVGCAGTLFTLYAGYHIVTFSREYFL